MVQPAAGNWALCPARTDWEAPKHCGMTMVLLKVHQPGIEIKRINDVRGSHVSHRNFAQE